MVFGGPIFNMMSFWMRKIIQSHLEELHLDLHFAFFDNSFRDLNDTFCNEMFTFGSLLVEFLVLNSLHFYFRVLKDCLQRCIVED